MAICNFCFKLWWCFDNTEKGKSFDLLLKRLSPTSTVVVQIDENSEPPPKKAGKRCSRSTIFSVSVERLFSIAGKVVTPERCYLTDSSLCLLG